MPKACPQCGGHSFLSVVVPRVALGALFYVCADCHHAVERRFDQRKLIIATRETVAQWNLIEERQ